MSEEFFMYAEDLDFCFRARRKGVYSYCLPAGAVIHQGGGTLPHDTELCMALVDRSRIHFVRLWKGPLMARLLQATFAWRSAIRFAGFSGLFLATGRGSFRYKARLHLRGLGYLSGTRKLAVWPQP
jgi:GT2 family glycosyltransferase